MKKRLADVQKLPDARGIEIDHVGVTDVCHPIEVWDKAKKKQATVARISLSANLPHHFKGTHMSRFMEILGAHGEAMTMKTLPRLLKKIQTRLNADSARAEIVFPYFLKKQAPVSGAEAYQDYECAFVGTIRRNKPDFLLRVQVPVCLLCPCSREISDYGAHNQRGHITLSIRPRRLKNSWAMVWIEDLITLAETSASAPVYPVLKREDERHVTMQAFDNPMFVEDAARNAAVQLKRDRRVAWFEVDVLSHESIHNHSARATVARH
jgi:GTP cyclohydrolase I